MAHKIWLVFKGSLTIKLEVEDLVLSHAEVFYVPLRVKRFLLVFAVPAIFVVNGGGLVVGVGMVLKEGVGLDLQ
jgi:hypothetical protein